MAVWKLYIPYRPGSYLRVLELHVPCTQGLSFCAYRQTRQDNGNTIRQDRIIRGKINSEKMGKGEPRKDTQDTAR